MLRSNLDIVLLAVAYCYSLSSIFFKGTFYLERTLETHPCLLNSAPMWSASRIVLRWPRVSVSGVGVLGLGCSAGQLSTTQPCLWPEGFRYSVAPPARTALKAAARSTLTRKPSHITSPPATGRTPLPRRERTLDITAGGTWRYRGHH